MCGHRFFSIIRGGELYVSPNGDDSGDGSEASPFRTIEHALEVVREKKADGDDFGFTVKLLGGSYAVSEPIVLSALDSSEPGCELKLESADKNNPARLVGGTDIPFSDLTKAPDNVINKIIDNSAADKILAYDLKAAGITDYGEISTRCYNIIQGKTAQMTASVDGNSMRLAGWPDNGYETFARNKGYDDADTGMYDVVSYGSRTADGLAAGCEFRYTNERPELWEKPELAWISGSIGPNYAYDYFPVKSVNADKKTITLAEGAITKYYSKPFFKFENILEELDSPGEYYIDREEGMLYLYPPEGSDESSVLTLSGLRDSMFKLTGVKNLTLEGLILEGGRDSAINAVGDCSAVRISGCTVRNFGKNGIYINNGSFCTVTGCEIYNIGENGVYVTGGDYENIIASGNVVSYNDIHDFALIERSYRAGVCLGYRSVGAVVRGNNIYNAPHAGIIFYGTMNLIEDNTLRRVVTDFHDMDAIYVNNVDYPWERGNVIRGNYFDDIGNGFLAEKQMNISAIRTDNYGHGLNIYHNVFHNIGLGGTNQVSGIRAQGTHNRIWENLFVDCSEAYNSNLTYSEAAKYDMTSEKNIRIKGQLDGFIGVYGKLFPELKDFWTEHPSSSRTNEFKDNVIVNIAFKLSTINGAQNAEGFRGAPELVEASGNLVTGENPGFADYENGNFSILNGSAAYETVHGRTNFQRRAE
ncbi:MAG: right-handed parallel beta-helix repeat-containing protein [Clostridia bacterium]|nr:right-handed parallel beta-helix repeat-containing protein [Clostridia bacterium]